MNKVTTAVTESLENGMGPAETKALREALIELSQYAIRHMQELRSTAFAFIDAGCEFLNEIEDGPKEKD